MRALLVVNPAATTTSARTRDVLIHALASEMKLEAVTTEYRGHARDLGRRAADSDDIDLVVALGGDGTVNEVVNGLLHRGPDVDGLPKLAVVPGGSTNVFARALGLPNDAVEATGAILDALENRTERTVGLGLAKPAPRGPRTNPSPNAGSLSAPVSDSTPESSAGSNRNASTGSVRPMPCMCARWCGSSSTRPTADTGRSRSTCPARTR